MQSWCHTDAAQWSGVKSLQRVYTELFWRTWSVNPTTSQVIWWSTIFPPTCPEKCFREMDLIRLEWNVVGESSMVTPILPPWGGVGSSSPSIPRGQEMKSLESSSWGSGSHARPCCSIWTERQSSKGWVRSSVMTYRNDPWKYSLRVKLSVRQRERTLQFGQQLHSQTVLDQGTCECLSGSSRGTWKEDQSVCLRLCSNMQPWGQERIGGGPHVS